MTRLFLKAKHWQLFVLMLGIPLAYQLYFMFRILGFQTQSDPVTGVGGFAQVLDEKFIQFKFFPYVMTLFILIFFGWFWSIAIGLQNNIPKEIKMKVKKFKTFFFIPFFYVLFLIIYMSQLFSGITSNGFSSSSWIIAIILPLHLLSMFCIFYSIYFAAKTIKTAELQKEVRFGDFVGEFFLLWFYFIGIWLIQPKVNKLYESNKVPS